MNESALFNDSERRSIRRAAADLHLMEPDLFKAISDDGARRFGRVALALKVTGDTVFDLAEMVVFIYKNLALWCLLIY